MRAGQENGHRFAGLVSTVLSEVGCGVRLGRRVVALEGALEGRPATGTTASVALLLRRPEAAAVRARSDQVICLLLALPTLPESPEQETGNRQDDGTPDTDTDPDDNVSGTSRHARGGIAVVLREPGGRRYRRRARHHRGATAFVRGCLDDDGGYGGGWRGGGRLLRGLGGVARCCRRRIGTVVVRRGSGRWTGRRTSWGWCIGRR